jgi:hypothetical protein
MIPAPLSCIERIICPVNEFWFAQRFKFTLPRIHLPNQRIKDVVLPACRFVRGLSPAADVAASVGNPRSRVQVEAVHSDFISDSRSVMVPPRAMSSQTGKKCEKVSNSVESQLKAEA